MEESSGFIQNGVDLPDNDFKNQSHNVVENGFKQDELDAFPDGNSKNIQNNKVAKMSAEKYASHYNMNHQRRGYALIFNHENFEIANLRPRTGTDQDRKNLEAVLRKLGFEVLVYQDLKFQEIESHLQSAVKYNHKDCDCFCIAVLSHGDNGILYAKDTQYKPEVLWSRFSADKCPSLAGKPKMFFLQACQGDKLDSGVTLSRTETDGYFENDSYKIPAQADFLIVYSTVKGFYSWRNTTKGSWFIQALCERLGKLCFTTDLLTILTFVTQHVALDFESNVPDSATMHQQKQIPCIMSMLTRLIQFNNGNAG